MCQWKGLALVSAFAFFGYPAFASQIAPIEKPSGDIVKVVCAEGGKNCLPKDAGHTKVGNQLDNEMKSNPGGDQECKGGGTCGVPGVNVAKKNTGPVGNSATHSNSRK